MGEGKAIANSYAQSLRPQCDSRCMLRVVEEKESRLAPRLSLDINFDCVRVTSDRCGKNGGISEVLALGSHAKKTLAGLETYRIVLMPETPLKAQFRAVELVRWVEERLLASARYGHRYG